MRTFGAELGAEFKQNKGNDEERDGDEAESAVGPCTREVCNHYNNCDSVRSQERYGEGGGGGGYLLLMMTRGNQAAKRMRREAAIVSADNVPAGG